MCINFNGSHSGGSTFVNVNNCWLLQNLLYTTDISSALKKKKINKESQYMVSHPETGSDSPIGSDRDRGRDNYNGEREVKETKILIDTDASCNHIQADKCEIIGSITSPYIFKNYDGQTLECNLNV